MAGRRELVRTAAWTVLPWLWFLVRDVHPLLDVIALAMPVVVFAATAACALVAVLRRRSAPLVTAVSWVVFGLVVIVGPWTPHAFASPVDPLRIAAVNVFGPIPPAAPVAHDVLAADADVVVLSEMSDGMEELVVPEYPHALRSRPSIRSLVPDVALVSRVPVEDLGLPGPLGERGVRARVEAPGGAFVLYALHLPPVRLSPNAAFEVSADDHQRLVRQVRDLVVAEELPVIVAGDLNLVDRTGGYRALTDELDDAMRADWVRPTSLKRAARLLLARVDHVFMPEGWCSEDPDIFSVTGSDHRGVAATVGPCP